MRLTIIIFFIVIFCSTIHSQIDDEAEEIKKIYENLQFKTIAFDDLKKNWLIRDHILTREIFNRFVVKGAIYKNGLRLKTNEVRKLAEFIFSDQVYVEITQRYYDKEIENLKFFRENQLDKNLDEKVCMFDPLEDCVYIREVLGERVYKLILEKTYDMNDITKEYYGSNIDYSRR